MLKLKIICILFLLSISVLCFSENNKLNIGGSFGYGGSPFSIGNVYMKYPISGKFGLGLDIYYVQQKQSTQTNDIRSYALTSYFTVCLLNEEGVKIEAIGGYGMAQSFNDDTKTTANFSPTVGIGGKCQIFSDFFIETNGMSFIYQDGMTIFSSEKLVYAIGYGISIFGGVQGLSNIMKDSESLFNLGGMIGVNCEL